MKCGCYVFDAFSSCGWGILLSNSLSFYQLVEALSQDHFFLDILKLVIVHNHSFTLRLTLHEKD